MRAINFNCQLVELRGELERRLVVRVVDAGQRVGADVEALVPLQDHRQRFLHPLSRDLLAVDLEGARARPTKAAEVVERERASAEAFVLEVKLDRMPPRRQRVRAFEWWLWMGKPGSA